MNSELWHPDIEVTEKIARASIEDQFPTLAPIKSIRCIGEGWDNKVFLINDNIIFRFPRRKIAVALIDKENVVLNQLQSKVSLEIPCPNYIGQPGPHYPYPFHGYPIIKGVSGCHAGLTSSERIASLTPLATFLKELHSITENEAAAMGAKSQPFDRTETEKAILALNERVDKIIAQKICGIDKTCFQQEMILAKSIKLPIKNKVLVHGDLYCRHLIFNQGKLTGIIDWGDLGINTRAIDLSVLYSFYPSHCQQHFFDIYGEVEPPILHYARFLGLYIALTVIPYGHDIGDTKLVTEAIDAVKRINKDLLT